MGTYRTKVLIDEDGESFMPITCEEAIIGGKYILSIFEAEKQTTNHYKITANNISSSNLLNKVVGLTFDNVSDASAPSFIQFNNETELPVYDCDGTTPLEISNFENIVALFTFKDNKWILIRTGSYGSAKHGITNTNHTLMIEQSVLWFDKFEVSNAASFGATRIGNPNWSYDKISAITGLISPDTWIPLYSQTLAAPTAGTYRLILHLELNDIETVNREVGIKIGSKEDWCSQYKRLNHTFIIEDYFDAGDNLIPSIYVDKISSIDTINIEECDFYIEHINVQ